jgi:glycerophosphoryl diester phosphodiesterase
MTQVIAHRGASRARRENTVAAFETARSLGADAVELDVRRTSDGVLVVHHDARLDGGAAIVDTPRADLPSHVPDLHTALDACRGMWVNVEIKNDPSEPDFDATDAVADEVIAALASRHEPDRWLISSFRWETIERCRSIDPAIRTAWLTTAVPPDAVDRLHAAGHSALHPWYGFVGEDLVAAAHGAGLTVNVWTCDDPDEMKRLAGFGIDGICTNVPDVARTVLST